MIVVAHSLLLDSLLEGAHRRGIDDAGNIARIAQQVLPDVARNVLDRMVDIAQRSGIYEGTAEQKRTR